MPPASGKRGRKAALILPDHAVRIAVLDFDSLPEKEEERRSLLNFRLRKSVPFDVDEAALSYYPQDGKKVLVALAPMEIVAHYEAPFRAAGLHPGLVTVSSLAALDLIPAEGSSVLARLSPGSGNGHCWRCAAGIVTIARSLELPEDSGGSSLEEVSSVHLLDAGVYRRSERGAAGAAVPGGVRRTCGERQPRGLRWSLICRRGNRDTGRACAGAGGIFAVTVGAEGEEGSGVKFPVNLASEPFRRNRPVLIGSAVAALLLIGTLGLLISLSAIAERRQAADTRVDAGRG